MAINWGSQLPGTWRGSEGPAGKVSGYRLNSENGLSQVWEFTGSKRAVLGVLKFWEANGLKASGGAQQVAGPMWRVQINIPFGATITQVSDADWSTSTEVLEKDIFSVPDVQTYAESFSTPEDPARSGSAAFKSWIEQQVEDGVSESDLLPGGDKAIFAVGDIGHRVFVDLCRGVTGWETEYQVVRRVRRGTRLFPFQRTIYQTKYVYSAAQLGFPSILGTFESETAPRYATWGWRIRTQDFQLIEGGSKVEETIEWIQSWWTTTAYEKAPGYDAGTIFV